MIVLPCLNEAQTVGGVIAGVPAEIPGISRIEIVVIDDGSTDDTAGLAARAGAQVVVHESNRGLGATFREAVDLALARGVDILVNIDGDGQFDAADIPTLVAPIVEDGADMVTASRFMAGQTPPEMPAIKRWGNHRVADIVSLLTGSRYRDVSCGFRAFSSEALLRLNLFGTFTYTQETFIDLIFKQMKIVEVSVPVRGTREFGSSRIAANLPSYALRALHIMLQAFISFRPLVFFTALSALFAAPGFGLLLFLAVHYLLNGKFSPHIWAGFVGGSLSFLAASTIVTGLVADMLVRIRLTQEKSLYFSKSADWRRRRQGEGAQATSPRHT
jgi:glycosyltransferase involved in cell wall biosynthesis